MNEEEMVTIEPVTRIGGEAKINIVFDEGRNVKNAYFQSMDYRGFENFMVGRQAEEVPRITTRVCGVCSWAHHLAAAKALDHLFGREPPEPAKKLRELSYCAHIIHGHLLHFFFLASPDFFFPPDEKALTRNFVGLLQRYPELTKRALRWHAEAERIQEIIAGKAIHPPFAVPGGITKSLDEEERGDIERKANGILDFTLDTLSFFRKKVIKDKSFQGFLLGDLYRLETYYMGLVDQNDQTNFYDGRIRVVDQEGSEVSKFDGLDYLDHIAEKVEPWTYCKFAYLKKVGWNGLKEGKDSGIFRVSSLPRLNVSGKMPTPRAQEAYEDFVDTLGHPAHATLGFHWARLVEVIYCAERMLELLKHSDIVSKDIMNYEGEYEGNGVGVVEAPQGTLIHHYEADENGLITNCNIVTPMEMNNAAICIEVRNSAGKLIKNRKVSKNVLNHIEMGVRAYDPCPLC